MIVGICLKSISLCTVNFRQRNGAQKVANPIPPATLFLAKIALSRARAHIHAFASGGFGGIMVALRRDDVESYVWAVSGRCLRRNGCVECPGGIVAF